jgi:general stress protein CsbA
MAVDIIGMIEGSLVMTHALRDKKMYGRMMKRMKN